MVEFFFDIGSVYSYLAATQMDAFAARTGAELRWRPFLLGGVFKATGNEMPARVAAKARYMIDDVKRWSAEYSVPVSFPSRFPLNTLRTQRALVAADRIAGEDAMRKLAMALFHAYWVDDRDVSADSEIAACARALELDADRIVSAIDEQETKDALRTVTDEAVRRGAFGAPTFLVGDALFWGNDRLHHLEAHLRR